MRYQLLNEWQKQKQIKKASKQPGQRRRLVSECIFDLLNLIYNLPMAKNLKTIHMNHNNKPVKSDI